MSWKKNGKGGGGGPDIADDTLMLVTHSVDNLTRGGVYAVNAAVTPPSYSWWFDYGTTSERDAYFASNPSQLTEGLWVAVALTYYQWVGGTWVEFDGTKTITLKVQNSFTKTFRVFDYSASLSPTNKVVVDFNSTGQGVVNMTNPNDDVEFYYIDGDGWWLRDNVLRNNVRV